MHLRPWKPILLVAFSLLFLQALETQAAAPSITSLNPTAGAVGSLVTIGGANFGTSQGTSSVTFNGITATATSWGAASIGVTVPAGATTGNVVVTVGGVASNPVSFTVRPFTVPTGSLNTARYLHTATMLNT
jgi:uncharacterized protein (TIGR03437 family)